MLEYLTIKNNNETKSIFKVEKSFTNVVVAALVVGAGNPIVVVDVVVNGTENAGALGVLVIIGNDAVVIG